MSPSLVSSGFITKAASAIQPDYCRITLSGRVDRTPRVAFFQKGEMTMGGIESRQAVERGWVDRMCKAYPSIPVGTIVTLGHWIYWAIPGGDFLTAVLHNDLMEAFGRADMHNRLAMFDITRLLYNDVPSPCYGSREACDAWSREVKAILSVEKKGESHGV